MVLVVDHEKLLQAHAVSAERALGEKVIDAIFKARRCIVVTGAGISVSGGIPDFRSIDGLYRIVKDKYPTAVCKGRDIFDANLFRDPVSTKVFYSFMSELKQMTDKATVTPSHKFLHRLKTSGKLLRSYTQNIDALEERLGLSCDLNEKSCDVVMLHGSLNHVLCTVCKSRSPFSEKHQETFKSGDPPVCPCCEIKNQDRVKNNRRQLPVGTLRPSIVLYNEHHSQGDLIASVMLADLRKRPDILIIMGTSLKVSGIRQLVRDMAREVRKNSKSPGCEVVMINKSTMVSMKGTVDICWLGEADEIVSYLERGLDEREQRAAALRKVRSKPKENIDTNQIRLSDVLKVTKAIKPPPPSIIVGLHVPSCKAVENPKSKPLSLLSLKNTPVE